MQVYSFGEVTLAADLCPKIGSNFSDSETFQQNKDMYVRTLHVVKGLVPRNRQFLQQQKKKISLQISHYSHY